MRTADQDRIYNSLYNSAMGTGPKIKTPQGWGLIKVQGQEPIIHVGDADQSALNQISKAERNAEYDLEKEQMAAWDSFKDSGEASKVNLDINDKRDPIDLVYSKMPKGVKNEYETRLLDLMERNQPTTELDKEFGFPDQSDVATDITEEELKTMSEQERKLYEIERQKYIEELKKSIQLNGGR